MDKIREDNKLFEFMLQNPIFYGISKATAIEKSICAFNKEKISSF